MFKLIANLDKQDNKSYIKDFNKLSVADKIYQAKLPVRLLVKENNYPKDSFGLALKNFMYNGEDIIDLFQVSLVPYRATRKKNTRFNKFTEATLLQHDMIHLLNGYDTSAFGESNVLAFSLAHEWRKSLATILFSSFFVTLRNTFMPSKYLKGKTFLDTIKFIPVWVFMRCIIEAYLRGKKAKWFLTIDWESYLYTPLEDVKKELNMSSKPHYWNKVFFNWKAVEVHYKQLKKEK